MDKEKLLNMCVKNPLFLRGKVATFTLENKYGFPLEECSLSFKEILKDESPKGKKFIDYFYKSDKKGFLTLVNDFRSKLLDHWEFPIIRLKTLDGNIIYSEVHIVPIYEGKKIVKFLGYLIDITPEFEERKLLIKMSQLAPVGVLMLKDNKVIFYNKKLLELTGLDDNEIKNFQILLSSVHPEDRDNFIKQLENKDEIAKIRFLKKNRKIKWLQVLSSKINYKNDTYTVLIIEDITKLVKIEGLKDLLYHVNKIIITSNSHKEIFNKICDYLPKLPFIKAGFAILEEKKLTKSKCKYNLNEEEIGVFIKNLDKFRNSKNNILYIKDINTHLISEDIRTLLKEKYLNSFAILPIKHKDLNYYIFLFFEESRFLENKNELEILKEVKDDIKFALKHIDQQKRLFIKQYYDEVTGLGNRNFFLEYLNKIKQEKKKFIVAFIDIYHFKYLNEKYGRDFGDKVLRYIGKNLDKELMEEDIFRVGFDEFAVVSTDKDEYFILDKVKQVFKNIQIDGIHLDLDFNMALIRYPDDETNIDKLVVKLERMLEMARRKGKGAVEMFSEHQYKEVHQIIEIEENLEKAILNNQLKIFLQPIVNVQSNSIYGAEALIRWVKEDGKIISPKDFIPVAERTGQIKEIDLCMLLKAKEVVEKVKYEYGKDISISINLTPAHIKYIIEFFEGKNIPKCKIGTDFDFSNVKNKLAFELTERQSTEVYESRKYLKKLKKLGFKISIDDFGTGYSSLSYLVNLDVDYIKIDMEFVQKMLKDKKIYKLVHSIIDIAHIFGLKTVAEGVETKEQLKELEKLKCDYYQGYLFSPPIPVEEFLNLLK